MKKTKNEQSGHNSRNMLDQKTGSMLDQKTNEDFNNEHPDHDENGLTKSNSDGEDKKLTKKLKLNINKK